MDLNLKKPIVYVTRDIERALGMEPKDDYYVVSNFSVYGSEILAKYPKNVQLIRNKEAKQLDTFDLLSLPEVQKMIKDRGADILVFQNTLRIERLAKEKGWNLLNPSASLSKTVEEKISQIKWLEKDSRLLPPFAIAELKDIVFAGKRFVLQFNHAHTGQGTYVIDSNEALQELKERFPRRECRVTDFVDGPVFTANVVTGRDIAIGNPSYQITGLKPFTELPFSTIGNDWTLPQRDEYDDLRTDMVSIAQTIGMRMKESGWRGLFGIDVVYDPVKKKTYLLEINARQPASTTFESMLQGSPSIFQAHIAALRGEIFERALPKAVGAQIVQRVIAGTSTAIDVGTLKEHGISVIEYDNHEANKELFRIQSHEGIMKGHNELDQAGEFIRSCIRHK